MGFGKAAPLRKELQQKERGNSHLRRERRRERRRAKRGGVAIISIGGG